MKKITLFILLLQLAFVAYPQYYADRNYFKTNVLDLDPIEGEYDVEVYSQGANAFQTFPENKVESGTVTIVKKNGCFVMKWADGSSNDIERIGETNVYYYCMEYSVAGLVKTRFYLNNSVQFEIRINMPAEQMKADLGRNYQAGFKVTYRICGIKKYPTHSMYITALEEAIREEQEQARQLEIEMSKPTIWTGTGFALNNGYIVTNYHVVEDAKSIIVKGINGDFNTEYTAEVAATDKYNDIAVLKISDSKFTGFGTIPYTIKTSIADVGEDIFVLGYPLTSTMGDEIKLTTGVVSSRTGFQGDVALYQISAPVQPGNSGGPLFDGKGNLIGIVSAKHTGAENVGYAIKASYLMNLVESSITGNIMPANNTISTLPLTGKVKNVKSFVFLIECSSK